MNASNGGEQGNTYEFNCYFHEIEWFTDGQKHEKARKFNYFVKKNTVLSWLIFFFFFQLPAGTRYFSRQRELGSRWPLFNSLKYII